MLYEVITLALVGKLLVGTNIKLGAQNILV